MRSRRRMRPTRRVAAALATAVALGLCATGCTPGSPSDADTAKTEAAPDYSNLPPLTLDGINERTQITITHLATGITVGTENQDEPRPGLSQNKLYIADWVIKNGTEEEKKSAVEMLKDSSDLTAQTLFRKYGQKTIAETADEYDLDHTSPSPRWGSAPTSTSDLVKFLGTKIEDDPEDPLLVALEDTSSVAADGYPQDFGTAVISGVDGTKWGWTDDRSSGHSSTSFGDEFVIAVHTYGSLSAHNSDVAQAVRSGGSGSDTMKLACSEETSAERVSAGSASATKAAASSGTGKSDDSNDDANDDDTDDDAADDITRILIESVPLPGLPALYDC